MSITGNKADRMILDDPFDETLSQEERLRILEKWWDEGMRLRLNQPGPVIIMARTHDKDIQGTAVNIDLDYPHLTIPIVKD